MYLQLDMNLIVGYPVQDQMRGRGNPIRGSLVLGKVVLTRSHSGKVMVGARDLVKPRMVSMVIWESPCSRSWV